MLSRAPMADRDSVVLSLIVEVCCPMHIVDEVLFRMPQNKELLLPAVANVQAYVNIYQQKARDVDQGQGHDYRLRYDLDGISEDDWDMLIQLGLEMSQPRSRVRHPQSLIDFSDERLEAYKFSGKHAANACGIMTGAATWMTSEGHIWGGGLPKITHRQGRAQKPFVWGLLDRLTSPKILDGERLFTELLDSDLQHLKDGVWTGFIGKASCGTALAAALWLPVIEIVPADRPATWLHKWINPLYRAVREGPRVETGIQSAVNNIESLIEDYVKSKKALLKEVPE